MTDEDKENGEVLLTEEDVWSWIEFARAASQSIGFPNIFTPDLINQRLKDITLVRTGDVSEEQVANALKSPKENEAELQRISEAFEITSSVYKRLLAYVANLAAFDLTYHATNAEFKDYKTPAYKKDLDVLKRFVNSFDYKREFSVVTKQMLRRDAYFGALRDEGEKFILQELPSDRSKITGRWDYGLLFSFDMLWFLQPGVDIEMYPDFFKEKYLEIFKSGDVQRYDPALPVSLRSNSSWVYWVDCSPVDGFWSWKMEYERVFRGPYFMGMFPDLVQQPIIRELQKSSYMAASVKYISGQVPLLKDSKASVKDMLAISPEILGKFLALIKSAVDNAAVKVASAPLEDMKGISFDSSNEMYSSYLKTTLGSSGINSNLLFSGDVKPNTIETMMSANVDEMLVEYLYPMFNNFMEYQINKRTKKFKFGIRFEGSNFYTDRQRRFDNQMKLSDKGIVLPQKISASLGMNPFELQAQMDEARAMGWVDNLTPIVSAFQQPSDKDGGRPKKSDTQLGESGEQTRSDGGNDEKTET